MRKPGSADIIGIMLVAPMLAAIWAACIWFICQVWSNL